VAFTAPVVVVVVEVVELAVMLFADRCSVRVFRCKMGAGGI